MAKGHFIQTSFTGGEWTDLLAGMVSFPKYKNAVYELENFIIYPHGPATYRPGFKYTTKTKDNGVAVLIPFKFSSTQDYMLEFGDEYIRVYKDQAIITYTAKTITNITKGEDAIPIITSAAHGFSNNDRVIITSVSGMAELNNREFTVTAATTNTFKLSGIDGGTYTDYVSGGSVAKIYEITSPYDSTDVAKIKYCQSADVIYLFHPDYTPYKLSRTGHTSWTLTAINFIPPATKEKGLYPAATLTPEATTGNSMDFTAGSSVFLSGDVNRIIQSGVGRASITSVTSGTVVVADIIDDFASTDAIASGSWVLKGSPTGNLTPSASTPKGGIITLTTALNCWREADIGKYVRAHDGFVRITKYTSATVVSGVIIKELTSSAATTAWSLEEAAWNATDGYPSCGTFFEERLCVARNETVWGSVVGDYENFTPGVDDADAFEYNLGGRNVNIIRWIEPREYMINGSMDSEWRLGPEDSGSALTPLNVVAKEQTTKGCADIMPVTIDNSTLFIQKTGKDSDAGKKLREFTWQWQSERFTAPDLTVMSEHITGDGLTCLAYQGEPLSIVWAARSDGVLVGLTYMREEEVVAWHRHPMDNGEVESLAVIPGDGYDEVWAIIKRNINGETVRCVEVMQKLFKDDADTYSANKGLNAFFVDSGLTYNGDGETATEITGLWHLNNEVVEILADGSFAGSKVVINGKITLDHAAEVVHIGLGYTGKIHTMRLVTDLADGTSLGKAQRTSELHIMVYRSKEFKYGRDITPERLATCHRDNLETVLFRDSDMRTGESVPLYTGLVTVQFPSPFTKDNRILIVQDKPMPLTIQAIVQEVEI